MTTDTKPWLHGAKIAVVSLAVTSSTLQTTATKNISFPHLNHEVFLHFCQFCWLSMEKCILSSPLGKHPHTLLLHPPVSFSAPFLLGTPYKPSTGSKAALLFLSNAKRAYSSTLAPLPVVVIIKYSDKSNLWDKGFMSTHSLRDSSLWPSSQGSKGQKTPFTSHHSQESALAHGAFSFYIPGSPPLRMQLSTNDHDSSLFVMVIKTIPTVMPEAHLGRWFSTSLTIERSFPPKIQFPTNCQKQSIAWAGRSVVLGMPTADTTHSKKKPLEFLRYK